MSTTATPTEPEVEAPIEFTGESASCINVSFNSELGGFDQGRRYTLVLPAETQYSNEAGPLEDDIAIDFGGLRDFRIPFLEDRDLNISSPRLHLWLPHGLGMDVNITEIPLRITRQRNGREVSSAAWDQNEKCLSCRLTLRLNSSPTRLRGSQEPSLQGPLIGDEIAFP